MVTVARAVEADDVRSLMVVAARVNGEVHSVFTPLTALAAGAGLAFGLVLFARTVTWLVKRPLSGAQITGRPIVRIAGI